MATRSLGVLSLDLVAKIGGFEQGMDKAEKRTQKWRKEVQRNVRAAGKAFAAGASVAAGALAIMTTRVINNAKEIENFSKVSNTGAEDFQRFAFAAERVGIEQDKLADILKDTSDRVGDFLQTGAGPMADFFENIAPQVGVTAEQFRNLSGADALGLYVDSLEKANLSQSEMTFFMEAIAGDATLLLPLLKDNGRELDRFGDQAEKAGAVLSRIELDNLLDAKENIDDLQNAITGLQNEVTINAVPAIQNMTELLSDPKTIEAISSVAEAILTVASAAVKATVEITEFTQGVAESAARLVHGEPEVLALERSISSLQSTLESGVIADGKLLTGIRLATGEFLHQGTAVSELEEKLKSLRKQREEFFGGGSQTQDTMLGIIPELDNSLITNATTVADKTHEAADNIAAFVDPLQSFNSLYEETVDKLEAQEAALDRQREAQEAYNRLVEDLQTDEERLTQQVRDRLAILDAIKDITDEQRQQTLGRIADAAIMDAPELGGASDMEDIDSARSDLDAWYSDQLDRLRKFREDRADLQETWDAEELALKEDYEKQLTEITQRENEIRTQQMLDGYSAILDVAGKYYEGLEGEEAAYARAAIQLGQTLLDEKKRDAIESILMSTHSAAMGAYDALASIPYVGPFLGAAAAAGIYVTGGIAAAEVSGLAHDGIDSIPEDGTWLLQRGERVTTAETSAKLDRTLDTVLEGVARGGRGGGGTTVNQTINVEGKPDRRTSTQIARDTERRQRMTTQRLGTGR